MFIFKNAALWSHTMGAYLDCRNDADKAAVKLLFLSLMFCLLPQLVYLICSQHW